MTDPDEKLLYQVVWKFFVACQMTPAVYNTLKVSLKQDTTNIVVKASGRALKDSGYMTVLGITDDSKIDIPQLSKGQSVSLIKNGVLVEKKQTKPPARFNEATLLKTLEVAGIGRPSTYASLLTKINDSNYVEKKNEVYYPTELGNKVTNNLKNQFKFMDYDFTSKLEDRLDLIAAGKMSYLETVDAFFKQFKEELSKAYVSSGYNICEKCGSPMLTRKSNSGDFLGCSNFPNCRNTRKI
jgi:DNA topoisomerase-1